MKFFCVESGEYLTFEVAKNLREAAEYHILNIIGAKGATLGRDIIIRNDYRGKVLKTFDSKRFLQKLQRTKRPGIQFCQNEDGVIDFSPLRRRGIGSSKSEAWQNIFYAREELVNVGTGGRKLYIRPGIEPQIQ